MVIEVIGQICGVLGAGFAFASYQLSTKKKILVAQVLTTLLLALNYLLVGGIAGAILDAVCSVRCIIYYYRDKKFLSSKSIPIAFTVILVVLGALSWQGPETLLVLGGLGINNLFLAYGSPQTIRKSILLTSPMVLVYSIAVFSVGGIITEVLAITSAIIGIIRYRKKA